MNLLPPESTQLPFIKQGLLKAREQLGVVEKSEDTEGTNTGAEIAVHVSLTEELATLDGELTVFVYAKAASGPPMPLAVQKMKVKNLPAKIVLNDSMAMMPEMRLSKFESIIVGARVSLSGEAIAKLGDWQGESTSINWQEINEVKVNISELVQ